MDKQGNAATLLYASALVIVVATALSAAAVALKPLQDRNAAVEKKRSILRAANLGLDADTRADKDAYILSLYDRHVAQAYFVGPRGDRSPGDAFAADAKAVWAADADERLMPVFECTTPAGRAYVLPLYGKGLWGPIWGYIALAGDMSTIIGVDFDHKSETPGLGAEIATERFRAAFAGKRVFEGAELTSVRVVKGQAPAGDDHAVDAITGGTITSRGVEQMLRDCLEGYRAFLAGAGKNKGEHE